MNMSKFQFSLIMVLTLAGPQGLAQETLKEELHYDFTVEKSKLQCAGLPSRSIVEFGWPELHDSGAAAELARTLMTRIQSKGLFVGESSDTNYCAAIDGWLMKQPDTLPARLYVDREQKVVPNCPVSRDEADACTYTLSESGNYQVYLGANPPSKRPISRTGGVTLGRHFFSWNKYYLIPLGAPSTSPLEQPKKISSRYADVVQQKLLELKESLAQRSHYTAGTEVAVPTGGDVAEMAVLEEIIGDGRATFRFVDVYRSLPSVGVLLHMGAEVPDFNGFKKDDRVKKQSDITRDYTYATVLRVFENGFLEVKWDSAGKRVVRSSVFQLAK